MAHVPFALPPFRQRRLGNAGKDAVGAAANLAELRKVSSYQQSSFVEKGGWATLPGSDVANSAVAQACANMLDNLK
jgi:nucleoid-associated protein YgaU